MFLQLELMLYWTNASSVKSIPGVTLSKNANGSIKCPYFKAVIWPTLKHCKWLNKCADSADSANDHIKVLKYFYSSKISFFLFASLW